jgi:hypothetical protein
MWSKNASKKLKIVKKIKKMAQKAIKLLYAFKY